MTGRERVPATTAALLGLAFAPAGAAAAALDAGTGWTLERLDLDLTVGDEGESVEVRGTAWLRLDADSSLGPTLGVNNREAVFEFREASVRGAPDATVDVGTPHAHAAYARLAAVRTTGPFAAGDELIVDFRLERIGQGPQAVFGDGVALASWVEVWYPVPIAPGEDPFASEKLSAPGTTTLRLPSGWSAVTNGARTKRGESDGRPVEIWHTEMSVARSWVAGPFQASYETFGGREIGVYLLSAKPVSAPNQAKTLAAALGAMEERFGPYPYASYAIVEIPEGAVSWYASSEQGFIMARSSAFEVAGGNVPLFAHEAAHGWWGNLVNTTGPGSSLCSESLAQYGAVVAIEAIEGREAMTEFLEYSRDGYSGWQCAVGYFGIVREGGDKPLSQLSRDHWDHNLSDSKGHWFYHMLRQRVGDDVFFATLRGLVRDFANKAMSLDDVRAAFVKAVPQDTELDAFLAQWLDRTGAPVIRLEWWAIDRGSAVEVLLTQEHAGSPYALDVEIEIATREGEHMRRTLAVTDRETRAEFETPGRAVGVTLDPDVQLLLWRPRYGSVPLELKETGLLAERSSAKVSRRTSLSAASSLRSAPRLPDAALPPPVLSRRTPFLGVSWRREEIRR